MADTWSKSLVSTAARNGLRPSSSVGIGHTGPSLRIRAHPGASRTGSRDGGLRSVAVSAWAVTSFESEAAREWFCGDRRSRIVGFLAGHLAELLPDDVRQWSLDHPHQSM